MTDNIFVFSKFDFSNEKPGSVYSFLNPYSLGVIMENSNGILRCDHIYYYLDGGLICLIFDILFFKKIERVSFDFTSIADIVFKNIIKNKKKIAIVGGQDLEVEAFLCYLNKKYSGLNVIYFSSGYFEDANSVFNSIVESDADYCLVGLGTPKQEIFGIELIGNGFNGVVYTCGGFITQTSFKNGDYYPFWINKLNLRFAYRFFNERHTRKRYVVNYPINIFRFFLSYAFRKIRVCIK